MESWERSNESAEKNSNMPNGTGIYLFFEVNLLILCSFCFQLGVLTSESVVISRTADLEFFFDTSHMSAADDIKTNLKTRIVDAQNVRKKIVDVEEAVTAIEENLMSNAERERLRICAIFEEVHRYTFHLRI